MNERIEVSKYKRTLVKCKPFVLIGNEIDGRVFCQTFYEFENFVELRKRLPDILKSIRGEGEWAFELYQVPSNYKIWHRWGYYRYPNRGKTILTHSYMNNPISAVEINERFMLFFSDYVYKHSRKITDREIEIRQVELNWKPAVN